MLEVFKRTAYSSMGMANLSKRGLCGVQANVADHQPFFVRAGANRTADGSAILQCPWLTKVQFRRAKLRVVKRSHLFVVSYGGGLGFAKSWGVAWPAKVRGAVLSLPHSLDFDARRGDDDVGWSM